MSSFSERQEDLTIIVACHLRTQMLPQDGAPLVPMRMAVEQAERWIEEARDAIADIHTERERKRTLTSESLP